MNDHFCKYLLWRSMMVAQRNGSLTEYSLLDAARFWWYDGYETNERFF
jgi:hypothetical protein